MPNIFNGLSEGLRTGMEMRERRRQNDLAEMEKMAELADRGFEVRQKPKRLFGGGGYELVRTSSGTEVPGYIRAGNNWLKDPNYLTAYDRERLDAQRFGKRDLKTASNILLDEPRGPKQGGFFGIGGEKTYTPEQSMLRTAAMDQLGVKENDGRYFGDGYSQKQRQANNNGDGDDAALIEEYQTTTNPLRAKELEQLLAQKGYAFQ